MGRREDGDRDRGTTVLAGLAELVAHRPHRHRAVLGLDDDLEVAPARDPRVDGQHEVALLRLERGPGLEPGPVEEVPGATRDLAEHRLEQLLEVGALGRGPGPLGSPGGGRGLDGDQALLEPLEPGRDLLAELVHRGVQPGRVEQVGELGGIAVEVLLEHPADPADGAVALGLVEQLVHHRAEGASVAKELLQRARQPAIAIGEVGSQRLLERGRGPLVDLLGLADHPLELRAHGVDVDRHPGVLERDQADAQGAFHERTPIPRRALPQERGEGRVRQGQALDDDAVTLEADRGVERDDDGFHERQRRTHP